MHFVSSAVMSDQVMINLLMTGPFKLSHKPARRPHFRAYQNLIRGVPSVLQREIHFSSVPLLRRRTPWPAYRMVARTDCAYHILRAQKQTSQLQLYFTMSSLPNPTFSGTHAALAPVHQQQFLPNTWMLVKEFDSRDDAADFLKRHYHSHHPLVVR